MGAYTVTLNLPQRHFFKSGSGFFKTQMKSLLILDNVWFDKTLGCNVMCKKIVLTNVFHCSVTRR